MPHPAPTPSIRPDGLQLEENRSAQYVTWVVQRIGWGLFALIVATAIAGLTGRGGLFGQQVVQVDAGQIEAPRVARRGNATVLTIRFAGQSGRHTLHMSLPAQVAMIDAVQPAPVTAVATPQGIARTFAAQGPAPHEVAIRLVPQTAGWLNLPLTLDGVPADLSMFVWP